ncbi:hypothetical protein [Microbacterium sp. NPDC058345]|uniref:hypothetical protein n=1 Tax=Microbacterium sp. NPDC058345 TaxID=3346455 RepID=UPI00366015DC
MNVKKTMTSLALAGILVLGGASAAIADPNYPVDEPDIVASDTTPAVGQPVTLTVTVPDGVTEVTFSITGAPAGSTLASTVFAAAGTVDLSVDKAVTDNTASAVFTPAAAGEYRVVVTGEGMDPLYIDVVVGATSGGGTQTDDDGLAVTGGNVPVGVIWAGVGAIGLGGIAVAAAAVRRRSNSSSNN